MEKKKEKTKKQRVNSEKSKLKKLYKELPESKKKIADGLIERAAFMKVELEDLEEFLSENGWSESFRQSDKLEPYDRSRPQGQTYNSLNKNYQNIIKQLNDLLQSKEEQTESAKENDNPLLAFIADRE